MASWLSRATDAFRKPPPPDPEPFSVRCDCGGVLSGERVPAAQRPSCPHCGRQVFILAANVYPVSVRPKKPEPPPSEPTIRESVSKASRSTHRDRRKTADQSKVSTAPPNGILLESRTQILTPFRLIVTCIMMIGIVTGWGLWYRHRVESAKSSVLAANEAGMKALREGDFVVAARELTRARDAVNLLARTDPEANSIRRHCREAVAGHGLPDSGLFELLTDYVTESRQGQSRFASRYRDSWLLLDAVIANPEATDSPCVVDMPLTIDNRKFRIEVDSPVIRAAAQREQATGPARLIFAAQMSEIRPPTANDPDSVLVLNGKTAFLWTALETYSSLGYEESDAMELQTTRDLIARQLEQTETSK